MNQTFLLEPSQPQKLIEALQSQGYTVIGPTLDQGDLRYGEIHTAAALPVGWRDEEEAGYFRLLRQEEPVYFGCRVGQHSLKQFLFPADLTLWEAGSFLIFTGGPSAPAPVPATVSG